MGGFGVLQFCIHGCGSSGLSGVFILLSVLWDAGVYCLVVAIGWHDGFYVRNFN